MFRNLRPEGLCMFFTECAIPVRLFMEAYARSSGFYVCASLL